MGFTHGTMHCMNTFSFKTVHKDTRTQARTGVIHTPHGDAETPAFVPVGTQGTVKSLVPEELDTLGIQLFFVNTYHIYLRPGLDVINKFGGLHAFMHWDKPLMTDSGGFQVFSLARGKGAEVADENLDPSSILSRRNHSDVHQRISLSQVKPDKILSAPRASDLVKITDDGVTFRSHWDGSKHIFTPESSMEQQWDLGADIHIAFDDCTPYPVTHEKARISMERTHRWAKRSLVAHKRVASLKSHAAKPYQALYGVVQGSVYEDLRKESAKFISSMDFDGLAIGGVAVGEGKRQMQDVLDWVIPYLPEDKPRHLLGVGEIDDIFALVARGVDTFDCVQPTRLARMGKLYVHDVKSGHALDITKAANAGDTKPVDPRCGCYTCQNFSRAYLHHLFRVRELLAYRLATIHNIRFVQSLVNDIRESIKSNSFLDLTKHWLYNK